MPTAFNPSRYSPLTAPHHVRVRWGKKSWQTRQRRAFSDLMECERQLRASGRRFRRPRSAYRMSAKRHRYKRPAPRSHHRRYGAYRGAGYGPYGPSSRFYDQEEPVSESAYSYESPFRDVITPAVAEAQKILRPDFTPHRTIGDTMTPASNPAELLVVHNPYGRRRRKYVSGSRFSLRHRRGARNMRRKASNLPLTVKVGGKRVTAKKFIGKMRKRGLSMKSAWRKWRGLPKYHGYSGGGLAAGSRRRRRKGKRKYGRRAKRRYSARAKRRYSRRGRKSSKRARAARKGWRTRKAKRARRYGKRRSRRYARRGKRRYRRALRFRSRRKIAARAARRYRRFAKLAESQKLAAYGMNPRRRRRRRR